MVGNLVRGISIIVLMLFVSVQAYAFALHYEPQDPRLAQDLVRFQFASSPCRQNLEAGGLSDEARNNLVLSPLLKGNLRATSILQGIYSAAALVHPENRKFLFYGTFPFKKVGGDMLGTILHPRYDALNALLNYFTNPAPGNAGDLQVEGLSISFAHVSRFEEWLAQILGESLLQKLEINDLNSLRALAVEAIKIMHHERASLALSQAPTD